MPTPFPPARVTTERLDAACVLECRADLNRAGAEEMRNTGLQAQARIVNDRAAEQITRARTLAPAPGRFLHRTA